MYPDRPGPLLRSQLCTYVYPEEPGRYIPALRTHCALISAGVSAVSGPWSCAIATVRAHTDGIYMGVRARAAPCRSLS